MRGWHKNYITSGRIRRSGGAGAARAESACMRTERDAILSLTLIELTSCTSLLDELRSVHVCVPMRMVRNRMDVFVAPLSGAGSWRRAPLTSAVAPQRARMETVLASNSAKTATVTHDKARKKCLTVTCIDWQTSGPSSVNALSHSAKTLRSPEE